MRVLLVVAAAGLVLAGPAVAQDWVTPEACTIMPGDLDVARAALAEVPGAGDAMVNGTGRLWRVTAPGGQVSHLWGTLHSSDPLVARPVPEIQLLLGAADVLILESDPRPRDRAELAERALEFGMWLAPQHRPHDKPYLPDPAGSWARARVEALFHDPEAFAALTDAGLAFLLFSDPCEDFAAGILPVQDHRLLMAALDAGVPVAGLERPDALVSDLSDPERTDTVRAIAARQAAYLGPEGFRAARAAAFALYLEGRIGLMRQTDRQYLQALFGPHEGDRIAALSDAYLVDERNRRFVRGLRRPLDAGGALVAVGAFHMPGPDGLVEALRAAGYRVERVPVQGEAP